jgi:hypothetical protein
MSSYSDQVSGDNSTALESTDTVPATNTAYVEPEETDEGQYDPVADPNYAGEQKTVEKEFVIKQHMDPERQKDKFGLYGDDLMRRRVEVERARVEGREPDFDNMGPTVGDVVITKQVAEGMASATPVQGVPVAFTADVSIGQPEVSDADGNVPDVSDQGHPEGSVSEAMAIENANQAEAANGDDTLLSDDNNTVNEDEYR